MASGCQLRDHMVTFKRDGEEPKDKVEGEPAESKNEEKTLETEEGEESEEGSEEESIWRVVVAHRWGGAPCSPGL